ncbi:Uncharacterised protein [Klebsiella pneumoniae]|nr:Uncharacterised protein [Klebsiella pneumoniae]
MQKIDRPGVDFHQHVLSDQLIEIMAGGISLHRETPGQPAGGKDLAQVIRIEKIFAKKPTVPFYASHPPLRHYEGI